MQTADSSKTSFFSQSGWMVIATFLGGVFLFGVHAFAPFMGDAEYSLFGTMLAIINVLTIPSLGLQTTFAQQAAAAITEPQQARLAGTTRGLLGLTFLLWLGFVAVVVVFRKQILGELVIPNPLALWLVLLIGLGALWQPILVGLLQGRQDFLWLGWACISAGLVRFLAVAIIVVAFGGKATGAVGGACLGLVATMLIAGTRSRMVWAAPNRLPIEWSDWLWRTLLLSLGLGAWQFIFSVDMIIVRYLHGENLTGFYSASGMIARGLVMFAAPIATVMFPKIVHSYSEGRPSRVLWLTLLLTGGLGVLGAGFATLAAFGLDQVLTAPKGWCAHLLPGVLLQKVLTNSEGVRVMARLIPWFVWSMVPLILSNVLLQNLLAHRRFRVVPWLLVVILAYVHVLAAFGMTFEGIIQVLGVMNLVFLAVLAGFTFLGGAEAEAEAAAWRSLP